MRGSALPLAQSPEWKKNGQPGGSAMGRTPEKDKEVREKRIKHQTTTPTQAKACYRAPLSTQDLHYETGTIQKEGKNEGTKVILLRSRDPWKKDSAPAEYEVKIGHCVAVEV
jgi:hypothetical protein